MRIIDLHQDLVWRLRSPIMLGNYEKPGERELILRYPKHYIMALTAVYPIQAYDRDFHHLSLLDPYHEMLNQIKYYDQVVKRNSDVISKILSKKDYDDVKNNENKTGFLYYVEGLYGINSVHELEILYDLGVRGFTLAWNKGNNLASGCKDKRDFGLTDTGEEIINFALDHGMLIDLVHIGRKAALDILEIADRNIFVSHTGIRALTDTPRNIDDDVISGIVDRKGVIGIIFFNNFLKTKKCGDGGLECFYEHVRYIIDNYGYEFVSFGSDFYGILPDKCIYAESNEIDDIGKVVEFLQERLSKKELEHMAYKNFERLILQIL